eukprot:m.206587 g.206587  ORF g.206587 m.206587 type:complete len:95 (-) comp13757_c0_seq9:1063-1347(-)
MCVCVFARACVCVQVYDPLLNEWRWSLENSIEPMPTPRTGLGKAVFFFGEFYVMGGEGDLADPGVSNKGVYDLVEIYNPILNQVTYKNKRNECS